MAKYTILIKHRVGRCGIPDAIGQCSVINNKFTFSFYPDKQSFWNGKRETIKKEVKDNFKFYLTAPGWPVSHNMHNHIETEVVKEKEEEKKTKVTLRMPVEAAERILKDPEEFKKYMAEIGIIVEDVK